jgi:2,5-diketo-D-gluconate reductase B
LAVEGLDLASTLEALTGLARSIGVCNFILPMLRRAVEEIGAPIASVQIEYHPYVSQSALIGYLRGHGLPLTAYAPLAQGWAANDPVLALIGQKYGVSAAQIAIDWLLDQPGVAVIPKAGRPESQKANLAALDIGLDDEDRAAIAALPKDRRFVRPPFAPDWDAVG